MGQCQDCAKWGGWKRDGEPRYATCDRHQFVTGYTWPDATCPAFEKRRDKLDEAAERIAAMARCCAISAVSQNELVKDIRNLLQEWLDKEAR